MKRVMARTSKYVPGDWALAVKRSSAGRGLFAVEPIPSDACVIEYVGVSLTPAEALQSRSRYLFAVNSRKTIDGKPRINRAGYINHACAPNCTSEIYRGRVLIRALRDIGAGEELTIDYGRAYFEQFIEPYGCRCVTCASARG
jgi:SET domain-containing protein